MAVSRGAFATLTDPDSVDQLNDFIRELDANFDSLLIEKNTFQTQHRKNFNEKRPPTRNYQRDKNEISARKNTDRLQLNERLPNFSTIEQRHMEADIMSGQDRSNSCLARTEITKKREHKDDETRNPDGTAYNDNLISYDSEEEQLLESIIQEFDDNVIWVC